MILNLMIMIQTEPIANQDEPAIDQTADSTRIEKGRGTIQIENSYTQLLGSTPNALDKGTYHQLSM